MTRAWESTRAWLPAGGSLPEQEWQRRHTTLVGFLWLNAILLPLYGLIAGFGLVDTAIHAATLIVLGALASTRHLGQTARSVVASVGLLTASALLVHLTGGLIEAHFYFFVMIVALTLYESWLPFLAAVAYVLLHHGVFGTIDPEAVYNRPEAWANPWLWAGIHAFFVSLAGLAGIVAWRHNERVRGQMREAQRELTTLSETDSLTGLGNRRKAMADLEVLFREDRESALAVIFDLDGFKAYNDAFGHPAGDSLLSRLGQRLAESIGARGSAYRLGGDEFLLISRDPQMNRPLIEQLGTIALAEQGPGFAVGASCGSVEVLREAASVSAAMHLADERMYARKYSTRSSAMSQSRDVLLQALTERYPEVGEHVGQVSDLVEPLAEALGVPEHELGAIHHASDLHDIGKVAIPEAILQKPGPLDEEEWEFMRRHTVIGQRIVAAAPALNGVGELIRSSHEFWNGSGYPDRLAGEQIPLGSRIISVCDAFDAMTSDRPYQRAVSSEGALAELARCAGTQFDPAVVAEFTFLVREREREAAHEARAERTADPVGT